MSKSPAEQSSLTEYSRTLAEALGKLSLHLNDIDRLRNEGYATENLTSEMRTLEALSRAVIRTCKSKV